MILGVLLPERYDDAYLVYKYWEHNNRPAGLIGLMFLKMESAVCVTAKKKNTTTPSTRLQKVVIYLKLR